jgi:Effector-associated domain 1
MEWNRSLAKLRDELARRFDDTDEIARLIDDAGLPRYRIKLSGASVDVWHSALKIAEVGQLAELQRVVEIETQDVRWADLFVACISGAVLAEERPPGPPKNADGGFK